MIQAWVESGRIFDVVLAVLVLEGLVLAVYWLRTGRGVPPTGLMMFLASGAFLIAAFRASALGAPWLLSSLFLTLAFVVHLVELRGRWRTGGANN